VPEVATAGAIVVVIVVAGFFATTLGETADVPADATQATRTAEVPRTVHATDLGAAVTVAATVIVIVVVTCGKHHLVQPALERSLVVRPEQRLVLRSTGRRQGKRG
jgi:anti-sigma factor RsiW